MEFFGACSVIPCTSSRMCLWHHYMSLCNEKSQLCPNLHINCTWIICTEPRPKTPPQIMFNVQVLITSSKNYEARLQNICVCSSSETSKISSGISSNLPWKCIHLLAFLKCSTWKHILQLNFFPRLLKSSKCVVKTADMIVNGAITTTGRWCKPHRLAVIGENSNGWCDASSPMTWNTWGLPIWGQELAQYGLLLRVVLQCISLSFISPAL